MNIWSEWLTEQKQQECWTDGQKEKSLLPFRKCLSRWQPRSQSQWAAHWSGKRQQITPLTYGCWIKLRLFTETHSKNLLNCSTILLENLIPIKVYRNSEESDWLWVCWRSQVDVIVGGRLWTLLEDKQVWGKPKTIRPGDFGSPTQWIINVSKCSGPEELGGQNYPIPGINMFIPH